MMRLAAMLAGLVLTASGTVWAERPADRQSVKLWPAETPHAKGERPQDVPALQVFWPEQRAATGSAIVVCPGGGYASLAQHEGPKVGEWLASNGVAAFVLRYRLGPQYNHPVQLGDAQRAIRFVRANAKAWSIDPSRIGIMGFSAGGHLASTAATHFDDGDARAEDPVDRVSSRPDIQILIYPVITMSDEASVHKGSRRNLLGEQPSDQLKDLLSSEKQVTPRTPPAFLVHSTGDKGVPVTNSDIYAEALKKAGVEYEYVRGDIGGHGFGMTDDWTPQWLRWLRARGY